MDHSHFDQRRYPVVPVRDGYGEWARTYEDVVQDEMDIRLLERIEAVDWARAGRVLDLACGTGRIGAWLRARGVADVDGVDFTPEMLAKAEARGVYRRLVLADILATGLPASSYDLIVECLADEHLKDLRPLYAEAARLAAPSGVLVLVGYHSHFLMNGIPTHFDREGGGTVTIESHVHLLSDHVKAAHLVTPRRAPASSTPSRSSPGGTCTAPTAAFSRSTPRRPRPRPSRRASSRPGGPPARGR